MGWVHTVCTTAEKIVEVCPAGQGFRGNRGGEVFGYEVGGGMGAGGGPFGKFPIEKGGGEGKEKRVGDGGDVSFLRLRRIFSLPHTSHPSRTFLTHSHHPANHGSEEV